MRQTPIIGVVYPTARRRQRLAHEENSTIDSFLAASAQSEDEIDARMDAVERTCRARRHLGPPAAVRAHLVVATRNRIIDRVRRSERGPSFIPFEEALEDSPPPDLRSVVGAVLARERTQVLRVVRRAIESEVACEPEPERTIIHERLKEKRTFGHIGRRLRPPLSEDATKMRFHRAWRGLEGRPGVEARARARLAAEHPDVIEYFEEGWG